MAQKKSAKYKFFPSKRVILDNFLALAILSGVFLFFAFLYFIHDMPDLNSLETKGRRASIIFESHDGKQIATYGDLFGDVVRVSQLPKYVGDALVAVEDRRFYHHCGVDFIGLIRAAYINAVNHRIVQGGSTLTQQLAKNLFLSRSKSIKRKIQEFVLALWLEHKFSKKQILSIYLNRVYFGACAYGIDAAAQRYFHKKAKQLTLYETAKLIGLLRAPAIYSPLYNPQKSDERAAVVLSCMVDRKYITENEMHEALLEKERVSNRLSVISDDNRYFTDWVMEQLQELVGADEEDLIVRTTMDLRLQKIGAQVIKNHLDNYGFANGASQMSLVAIDKSGGVRALLGGYSYAMSQYNRALALRSVGSVFKYFVYLTALEHGMDVYDRIDDRPITIGSWTPKNYSYKSIGSVTLMDAYVKSLNTCAVHVARKIGITPIIKKAEKLGITSEIKKDFSSALGSSGVSLLEMTSAFSVTMRDGLKVPIRGIISVRNRAGKFLYKAPQIKPIRVVSFSTCQKMRMMMREIMNRGTGKRAKIPRDCYGKTGTSNDSRDACFIGVSDPLTVGIWMGNDDNTPMHRNVTGGTIPAMAWKEFMLCAFGYKKPEIIEKTADNINSSVKQQNPKNFSAPKKIKKIKHRLSDLLESH